MVVKQITRGHDNCILFAWRVIRYGKTTDYLMVRKSKYAWFPHFAAVFELDDGKTICRMEYVPNEARTRWIPPWLFKGHVKTTYYAKVSHDDTH
jgi:hypothetical protein